MTANLFSGNGATFAAVLLSAWATFVATSPVAASATCHARSGPLTVPLVELFTSEGCDSCPPADRWLSAHFPPDFSSRIPAKGGAAPEGAEALALAFHVDYWDRLGWRDRFASAQFTQRQYDEMRANRATFVYTPQVLVQGHDVPGWSHGKVTEAIAAVPRRPPRAAIGLDVTPGASGLQVQVTATVEGVASRKSAALWLAYADSGHVTEVAAGENRGARLRHDHVVRSLHGPYPVDANGVATAALALALPADPGDLPMVVAFVQDAQNGDVLQALAAADCR